MKLTDFSLKNAEREIFCLSNVREYHDIILICLHGFAGDKNSSVIAALSDVLDKSGIGIIAPDWPAHGESRAEDEELTVENCLSDLQTIIEEIGQRRIFCFATSFGGYIAALYRNDHPEVFEKTVLRSPALKIADSFRKIIGEDKFRKIENGEKIEVGFERIMLLGNGFYQSLVRNPVYDVPAVHPESVLILQGDEDDVVDPSLICEYARKNGIRLELFEGTDHRYKKPGELEHIVEATVDFLKEQAR